MSSCVFCQRIEVGDYNEGGRGSVYFEPLNPVVPGHMLFIHRLHSPDAAAQPWITGLVCEAAAVYGQSVDTPFNLITSVGAEATQTIRHLHVHYVPRREGDGLTLPWTGQETRS
jgi:histidine triad (HIT) family protein